MSKFDRRDPPSDGLDSPDYPDFKPMWKCATCGTRFELGPATTHARETGHPFTFRGFPVDLLATNRLLEETRF